MDKEYNFQLTEKEADFVVSLMDEVPLKGQQALTRLNIIQKMQGQFMTQKSADANKQQSDKEGENVHIINEDGESRK